MSAPSVLDVAEYILQKQGPMTAMKLQKLVYYAQAWSLVWDEAPVFDERIEAWANGPVVRELYEAHRGCFTVATVGGDSSRLDDNQKDSVNVVLDYYGGKRAQWLSDLTHRERPWREAREGLGDGERGSVEITHAALAEYYSGL